MPSGYDRFCHSLTGGEDIFPQGLFIFQKGLLKLDIVLVEVLFSSIDIEIGGGIKEFS
jgi:hypothetical protein